MPQAIARRSCAIPLLFGCVEPWLTDRCKSGFAAPWVLVSAGGHADECAPLTWHARRADAKLGRLARLQLHMSASTFRTPLIGAPTWPSCEGGRSRGGRDQPQRTRFGGVGGERPGTQLPFVLASCGQGTFSTIISQTSRPLPSSTALAV